jgi:D-tyrosyl-tRNA(Tyr) deacylase
MRALLQRVNSASVRVDGETVGAIAQGYLVFIGFKKGDEEAAIAPLVKKIVELRLFPDDRGRPHFSLLDVCGELLVVSQFTLYADTSKGRRPEFFAAMEPQEAERFYELFLAECRKFSGLKLASGRFRAHMTVSLENDGPVTLLVEG